MANRAYRWAVPAVRAADIASLARTPSLLGEIVLNRPQEWLDTRHIADGLSPREVLGHFIHGEKENWIPRIRQILESGDVHPFKPFDVLGGNTISHERDVSSLVDEFETLRQRSLKQLRKLQITDSDLGKPGLHPKFGRVTLDELLGTWVSHDLYHLGQIFKSFAAPFRDWIGPWQEILNLPNFN